MRTIRNVPVAVVGGAGFLGSHLVDHLINDRLCDVLVIDNLVAGARKFVHPKAKFEHADIAQSEGHLYRLFKDNDVRYVFNYAAYPYVPDSYARPIHVFMVNAIGAMNVINAASEAGAQGILQVSSAELYGGPRYSMFDGPPASANRLTEESEVSPHSSYGASKAAIDAWVQVRFRESKAPCIALRQFNCVGERETHPYVVPEIISQLNSFREGMGNHKPLHGPTISLGNNSFRDFLYAGDAVRMATELLEKGQFGEVYNLGSESGENVYDLAYIIYDEWVRVIDQAEEYRGLPLNVVEAPARKRAWEIWRLQSNNAKIHSVISARPMVSLREAIRRTIEYYKAAGYRWVWETS